MNKERVELSCKTIDLAETKTYLELLNRICFYDEPNYNGTRLLSDTAEERAATLVNMPIKAKCLTNAEGNPTFGGHEPYIDEDGDVAFDTVPIGVHTETYVAEDDVDVGGTLKRLPCLFAKQRIWTENKNVVAAVKRLFEEDRLYNSWEVTFEKYEYDNGIKTLIDYTFTANVFLGSDMGIEPAYGHSAKVLDLAENRQSPRMLIAEAVAKDMLVPVTKKLQESEDNHLKNKENASIEEAPVVNETSTESAPTVGSIEASAVTITTTENSEDTVFGTDSGDGETMKKCSNSKATSSMAEWDLRGTIRTACEDKTGKYCWVSFHFPAEKTVWVEEAGRASELDYLLFTYEVGDNDTVTVSEPTPVKLTVSLAQANQAIAEKNETIVKMSKEISELKSAVAALEPFRDAFDKAEKEKQISELQGYVKDSGAFSTEELESEEVQKLISEMDKPKLQEMIADRLVSSYRKQSVATETATKSTVKADFVDVEDYSYKSVMSDFLKN